MNYFKQILRFAVPYKIYGFLNIFANILYALFTGLSFMVLMPLLKVLFDPETELVIEKPVYEGFTKFANYFNDFLNYHISQMAGNDASKALIFVIILILSVFLLKNIFNYLAMYFITFLRNGVLKDLRNELYQKTIELPLSFFSEKRKGDIMARIGTDVLEIQHSFLSILELIFREPLTIIFTILFMLTISVKLTIFVFIFIPVSGFIISLIGKSLKRKSDKVQKEQGHFLSLLEESLEA
jgi:subfamily B ATP-binding cassette protein MsbA